MEPSVEFKEYRVFLNWLNTKQQERVAACKVILDCPANFTEQSDLVCVSKLQRRPYPPFQPGVFYEGLNESEAWSLVRTSNTETPAAESKYFVSIFSNLFTSIRFQIQKQQFQKWKPNRKRKIFME